MTIIQNPTQFKIPTWFLNRQKDIVDGKNFQILSNGVDSKLRDDLERLKKIRAHRGLRHFWGLRVRGQHTKTTGASWWCRLINLPPQLSSFPQRSPGKDRRCLQEAWLNVFSHAPVVYISGVLLWQVHLQNLSDTFLSRVRPEPNHKTSIESVLCSGIMDHK